MDFIMNQWAERQLANMSKRVLISGGAGFLGSHLADYYLAKGYEVVAIDNLSTGSENNLAHLKNDSNFSFIVADIVEELPQNVTQKSYDIILNMASPASPPHYQRLSIETLRVGSEGTLRLLELARDKQARFFQASTSEVYGDPLVHPQPESYRGSVNCYGPRAMYDEAKRYAEALIYSYRQRYPETSTCIARFFNTYGPRMDADDGRVVSNLIVQALAGKDLTIYGEGTQTRSFCYVSDLVEGIARLIDSEESDPMNLGNPGKFTIEQLADVVIELTGSQSRIKHAPLPADDPLQRKPDITRAREVLNWEPTVALRDGLQKTIEYFKVL
jgi:nucleoside-diphosphate-sugar epimerase